MNRKEPIQWIDICRVMELMGLKGPGKAEAFRIGKLLKSQIAIGRVKKIKRGLYCFK